MSDEGHDGSGVSSWVPQLFYDIIARLVPGAVLIGALVLAAAGPAEALAGLRGWLSKPSDSYPSVVLIVGAIFVLSYTLAIVLHGFGSLLMLPLELLVSRLYDAPNNKPPSGSKPNKDEPEQGEPLPPSRMRAKLRDIFGRLVINPKGDFPMRYDYIKRHDPTAGSRITKLKAEMHMASILIFGFGLSYVINLWLMRTNLDPKRALLGKIFLIAIAGSAGALFHFVSRQRSAVQNCSCLLGFDEWWREQQKVQTQKQP